MSGFRETVWRTNVRTYERTYERTRLLRSQRPVGRETKNPYFLDVRVPLKTPLWPLDYHCITCVVNSSVVDKIIVASIYSPPSDFSPLTNMRHVFDNLGRRDIQRLVLCGDFNAHSNVWSNNSVTDSKGEEVEGILLQHNMIVINNPNSPPTFDSG